MEKFNAAVLEEMPLGCAYYKIVYDTNEKPKDFIYLYANRKYCEMVNKHLGQLKSFSVFDVFPSMKAPIIERVETFEEAVRGGEKVTFELYDDVISRYFEIEAFSPERGYFIAYVTDITTEKEQVKEIAEINKKFVEIDEKYRIVSDYFFDWETWEHTSGELLYVSNACERITGYSAEAFLADPHLFERILHLDDLDAWRLHKRKLTPTTDSQSLLFRIVHREGHVLWIEHRCMPAYNKNGVYLGYRANNRDITRRVLSEQTIKSSEERYRQLFEHAVEGIVVLQGDYVKICNPKLREILGYAPEQLMAVPFAQFIYHEDLRAYRSAFDSPSKAPIKAQFRVIYKNGEIRWLEATGIEISWNGQPASLRFVVDVTERKMTEQALKRSEEKYRLLTEHTSDVIWIYNLSREVFSYISPSIKQLRGLNVRSATRETLEASVSGRKAPAFIKAVKARGRRFEQEPGDDNAYIDEVQQRHEKGHLLWVEISSRYRFNAFGEVELVGVSRNIEERKCQEDRVLYLSYYDQLTGLHNRRYYEEQLAVMDCEEHLPLSLVLADVNGLKLTNDAFGHYAGDHLLIEVAKQLATLKREGDVLARIGGDEFVFVLPNTTGEDAEALVSTVQKMLRAAKINDMEPSISLGWATKTQGDQNIEDVFTRAEDFMYKRKLMESRSMKNKTIKYILQKFYKAMPHEKSHGLAVRDICKQFSVYLGLSDAEVQDMGTLGLLHDIGKVGMDRKWISSQCPLVPEQWNEIKRHPEIGYQILRSTPDYAHLADYCLSHHERFDGEGYPRKLKGEMIPLQARILSIVEAYVYMTQSRPYKKEITPEVALDIIEKASGRQFDPEISSQFVRFINEEKALK